MQNLSQEDTNLGWERQKDEGLQTEDSNAITTGDSRFLNIIESVKIKPYYLDLESGIVIYCADNREILPLLPKVDLVLTDPPYGIDYDANKHINKRDDNKIVGDSIPFDPTPLLKFGRLILWGANCYASKLPDSKVWLVWIKTNIQGTRHSQVGEADFAWTNCITRTQIFRFLWQGYYRDGEGDLHLHPTQKPSELFAWCLNLVPKVNLVFDPFLGSGTTAVAAKKLGRKCIGIEIEEKYCKIAVDRLRQSVMRLE